MKKYTYLIKFIILFLGIISLFSYVNGNVNNEVVFSNYENEIIEKGEKIISEILIKKNLNIKIDKNNPEYKKFVSDLYDSLPQEYIKNNKGDAGILYEYDRIIHIEPGISVLEMELGEITKQRNLEKIKKYPQLKEKYGKKIGNNLKNGNYNRTSAANYALKWVGKSPRNNSYNYYQGEYNCTNFTSQALKMGGLTEIDDYWLELGKKRDKRNWYYSSSEAPSWTWGGANNFFNHAKYHTDRFENTTYLDELNVGDILQLDIGGNGQVNHSMIVTLKDDSAFSGESLFLTYSNVYDDVSTDRKNRFIDDIIDDYPVANNGFYGWIVTY